MSTTMHVIKHAWTSKDVHFDQICFPYISPSTVTVCDQGLLADEISWLGDYHLQSHESSSNPLTSTQSNPRHDSVENSSSHAPNFNEHVQESRDLHHHEIHDYQTYSICDL